MEQKVNFVGNGKLQGKKILLVLKWKEVREIKKWKSSAGEEFITLDLIPRAKVSDWGHSHVIVDHQDLPQ